MMKPKGRGSFAIEVSFLGGGKTDITVDFAAEESVCPWEWGAQFPVRDAERTLNLVGAGGHWIENFGQREVDVVPTF